MKLKRITLKIASAVVLLSMILSATGCGKGTPPPTLTASPTTAPTATHTRDPYRANPPFVPKSTNTGPSTPKAPTPTRTPTSTPTPKPAGVVESTDLDHFNPSGAFVVRFEKPMDPKSSRIPLMTFPYVDGVSSWNSNYTVLSFQPSTSLELGKDYTFFLDPAIKTNGNAALPSTFQWQVKVDTGPQVDRVTPAAGQIDSRKPLIAIHFDRPMRRQPTQSAIAVQPSIAFQTDWLDDNTVRILLTEPLALNVRYDFRINTDAQTGAVDAKGVRLADTYVWSYWLDPLSAAVKTIDAKTVEVSFSRSLQTGALDMPFKIQPVLEGTWEWKTAYAALFTAANPIPLGKKYNLSVSPELEDEFGPIKLGQNRFSFEAPPPVEMVFSSRHGYWDDAGVEYVDLDVSPISVQFSVAVDHTSAEKAFTLTPSIPGSLSWEVANGKDVLVFQPKQLLNPGSRYEIQIAPTVTGLDGERILADAVARTFQAEGYYEYYMYPSFGGGADSQVVDADGWRFVQYGGDSSSPSHFELYGYSLNDFAGLYANQHGDRRDWPDSMLLPIPAQGQEAAADWWQDPKAVTAMEGGTVLETAIPADVPAGLYVLNYKTEGVLYDQLFIALSSNTLMLKRSGDELLVWLTNIKGNSVPNAEIRLYSTRAEVFQEGTTDEKGLYQTPLSHDYSLMFVSARVVDEEKNEDITIAGLDGQWQSNSYYYEPYYYSSQRDTPVANLLTYIYTDRPIYRPGQVVNFKAILRRDHDVQYSLLPTGTPVLAQIRDSHGNVMQSFHLALNDFGTVNGSFQLAEGAAIGEYDVLIQAEGTSSSQVFKVEEYRKPDFQVSLKRLEPLKTSRIVVGDELKLEAEITYFFGEPLKNPKIITNSYFLYPNYYYWYEDDPTGYYWQPSSSVKSHLSESDGKQVITVSVPSIEEFSYYYSDWYTPLRATFAIELVVDDGSNQTVSGSYIFDVYRAAEVVSLETSGRFQEPGVPFTIRAAVKDLAGQPVADRKLSLTFSEYDRSEWKYKPTSQAYDFVTDEKGEAKQELSLPSGWYRMEMVGLDARQNSISATDWMYVFKTPDDWIHRTQEKVQIAAEQSSYKPYQTARLMIESEFSGPALLTFERGSVINTLPVQLTAPFTLIETDILPEYAPNVFITVNAWESSKRPTDAEYDEYYWGSNIPESYLRQASVNLQVDAQFNALQVEITSDQQVYSPGDTAKVTISVKDAKGQPARAEVSLSAVDEAIFALSEELSAPIFSALYRPRPNKVRTYDSMAPDRIITQPGGRGSGGEMGPAELRGDFQDAIAWYPALYTDNNGLIRVEVPLPDNLTSWRFSAKAITLGHQVGQATANVQVKKDLIVRPVLPRFLTAGDQTTITIFVHNYSDRLKTIDLSLEAAGLDLQGKTSQKVVVSQGDARPVTWLATAQNVHEAELTFTAVDPEGLSDGVRLSIPIQSAVVSNIDTFAGDFTGEASLNIPLPPVSAEASQVTLELNRSKAGTIMTGLDYLTGYPYGCIEQTMSRALPNAVVSRAASLLGLDPGLKTRVDPLVKASIQKLYAMQHGDGGWGWWYDDTSDDYQTAWVIFGLALISQAGYDVDPQVIERAANILNERMSIIPEDPSNVMDLRTQAYALYSLSLVGKADPDMAASLMDESLNYLDTFSQAALALAFEKMGDHQRAQMILDDIDTRAILSHGEVLWYQASQDGEYHQKTMSSSLRTTALVLDAHLEIDPWSELIPGMVTYLISHRKGIEGWGTTNETTYAILALTNYLVTQKQEARSLSYEILIGNQSLQSGVLDAGRDAVKIELPLSRLALGINTLTLKTEENARLYYALTMNYGVSLDAAMSLSQYKVSRRYVDMTNGAAMKTLTEGHLIRVELEITIPEDLDHAVLIDYLPGGLEAVNEGLNVTSHGLGPSSTYNDYYDDYRWQEYGYNYKDIRDDRVAFFFTVLGSGKHTYSYMARANFSGQFVALPAEVYAMYDLSKWGRSASNLLMIEK